METNLYARRRLRLGALLYRLGYYAVTDRLDAEGRIILYRRDQTRYIEVLGSTVRLVFGDAVESLELEEAISRCKAALAGRPLPESADERSPSVGQEQAPSLKDSPLDR